MQENRKEKYSRQEVLKTSVLSSAKILWEGEAHSVSSKNTQGEFDILPQHANFITLVNDYPVRIHAVDGSEHSFSFSQSVIIVQANNVKIFGNIE